MKLFIATIITFVIPYLTLAQAPPPQYQPLVGIPGVNPNSNFDGYINSLYVLSISIAALLAVIKIIIAGVQWMTTDIVPNKSAAKKNIQGALLGLLVVLSAVLILTVINPNITTVNFSITKLGLNSSSNSSPGIIVNTTNSTNTAVPAGTVSPSTYTQFTTLSSSGKTATQFGQWCRVNQQGSYVVNHVFNTWRCYNAPLGKSVTVGLVCGAPLQTAPTCTATQIKTAQTNCTSQGGVYSADPNITNGWICVI